MSNTKVLGAVLLSSMVWGCAYTPVPFEGKEPKGPGLFTGQSGKFVLVGKAEEDSEPENLKKPPIVEEKIETKKGSETLSIPEDL